MLNVDIHELKVWRCYVKPALRATTVNFRTIVLAMYTDMMVNSYTTLRAVVSCGCEEHSWDVVGRFIRSHIYATLDGGTWYGEILRTQTVISNPWIYMDNNFSACQ